MYLGFQVLAGIGLTPRRMATNVPDRDLRVGPDGAFSLVFAASEPSVEELAQEVAELEETYVPSEVQLDGPGVVVAMEITPEDLVA